MSMSISSVSPVPPISQNFQSSHSTSRPEQAQIKTAQSAPVEKKPAVQAPAPVANADEATNVTLSQTAQVQQLSAEGENVSQIAGILGMSVSSVDTELGYASTAVASTPTATTAPAATAAATPDVNPATLPSSSGASPLSPG